MRWLRDRLLLKIVLGVVSQSAGSCSDDRGVGGCSKIANTARKCPIVSRLCM